MSYGVCPDVKYYATRAQADDAWANAAHIPGSDGFIDRWSTQAAAFRQSLLGAGRVRLDHPYGDSERQAFDLFLPEAQPQGLLIFIHGGYWIRFDRSFWSHFARGGVENGWAVAMPGYDLCPSVTIPQIVAQITSAVQTISAAVPDVPISLAGHSAGGHLTARMLEQSRFSPEIESRFHRAVPISPVTDLRPLLETSMNDSLRLTPEMAAAESPTLGQSCIDIPVTVWVGAAERPVFIQQAQALAAHWTCACEIAPDRHHFDVIDPLQDPQSALMQALIRP